MVVELVKQAQAFEDQINLSNRLKVSDSFKTGEMRRKIKSRLRPLRTASDLF